MASARFAMTHMMLMLLSPVRCEAKNKSYRADQRMGSLRYDIGIRARSCRIDAHERADQVCLSFQEHDCSFFVPNGKMAVMQAACRLGRSECQMSAASTTMLTPRLVAVSLGLPARETE